MAVDPIEKKKWYSPCYRVLFETLESYKPFYKWFQGGQNFIPDIEVPEDELYPRMILVHFSQGYKHYQQLATTLKEFQCTIIGTSGLFNYKQMGFR